MKDLRSLGRNTIYYGIGVAGSRGASFLLLPLYTHYLSLRDFGLLSTLLLTVQVASIIVEGGTRTAFMRFAQEYDLENGVGKLLGSSLFVILLGGIIVTVISLLISPLLKPILHTEEVCFLMQATCVASISFSLWNTAITYYRANNEASSYMFVSLTTSLLFVGLNVLFFIGYDMGITGALLAYIMTYTIGFAAILLHIFPKTGLKISANAMAKLLGFGLPLVLACLCQLFMLSSGIYFLNYFVGLEVVAIFALGSKFAQIVDFLIITPFQLSYQPYVFANLEQSKINLNMAKVFPFLLVALALMNLAVLIGARFILPIIAPPEYSGAYTVILLMLPMFTFKGIYYYGETFLNIKQQTFTIGKISTIIAVMSLILYLKLIPLWGWHGAVVTSNLSWLLIALSSLFLGIKAYPIKMEWAKTGMALGLYFSVFAINILI